MPTTLSKLRRLPDHPPRSARPTARRTASPIVLAMSGLALAAAFMAGCEKRVVSSDEMGFGTSPPITTGSYEAQPRKGAGYHLAPQNFYRK